MALVNNEMQLLYSSGMDTDSCQVAMATGSEHSPRKARHPSSHELSVAEFEGMLRGSKRLVLAAFLASWSQPCHLLNPILEEIQSVYQGRVGVVIVDADRNPELGVCYVVESIPTLLYIAGGRICGRRVGLASKEVIVSEIEQMFGGRQADTALVSRGITKTNPRGE
jgi:thioredoxin 1